MVKEDLKKEGQPRRIKEIMQTNAVNATRNEERIKKDARPEGDYKLQKR